MAFCWFWLSKTSLGNGSRDMVWASRVSSDEAADHTNDELELPIGHRVLHRLMRNSNRTHDSTAALRDLRLEPLFASPRFVKNLVLSATASWSARAWASRSCGGTLANRHFPSFRIEK
ncbi:MAG: hypothetical protein JST54_01865 [Deltaproteobacteria bacterium]|nr:hypothetical protein [Deltaproteobacteria bacterium]